jgi:ATP-binding cassette subfamily B protein
LLNLLNPAPLATTPLWVNGASGSVGGQRQRIGIARALYKQASVLIFDEATSALDNATESALIEAIEGLSRELTIVMIAHRLSTVERCDRVIELEEGTVKRNGSVEVVLGTTN